MPTNQGYYGWRYRGALQLIELISSAGTLWAMRPGTDDLTPLSLLTGGHWAGPLSLEHLPTGPELPSHPGWYLYTTLTDRQLVNVSYRAATFWVEHCGIAGASDLRHFTIGTWSPMLKAHPTPAVLR